VVSGCRYGSFSVDERTGAVRASARRSEERSAPLYLYQTPTEPVEVPFGDPIDIVQLTAAMIEDALGDASPVCSGQDGLNALEMVAAVHLSGRSGMPVSFPLEHDGGCLARIP
jgi:hypothetical protein